MCSYTLSVLLSKQQLPLSEIDASKIISEVSRYKRGLYLGEREVQVLSLIAKGENSSYRIFSLLKKAGFSTDYKNINKRVKRLHELNLIREARGESIHNARFYTLTSEGLFYLLAGGIFDVEKSWFSKYKDNIVLKYLLEPYFEENTIVAYGVQFEIAKYLQECCQMIMLAVKTIHTSRGNKSEEEQITGLLDLDLKWQAKALAFKLISKPVDIRYNIEGGLNTPKHNASIIFTKLDITILAKDGKFMKFSESLGREYERAFSKLVQPTQRAQRSQRPKGRVKLSQVSKLANS